MTSTTITMTTISWYKRKSRRRRNRLFVFASAWAIDWLRTPISSFLETRWLGQSGWRDRWSRWEWRRSTWCLGEENDRCEERCRSWKWTSGSTVWCGRVTRWSPKIEQPQRFIRRKPLHKTTLNVDANAKRFRKTWTNCARRFNRWRKGALNQTRDAWLDKKPCSVQCRTLGQNTRISSRRLWNDG